MIPRRIFFLTSVAFAYWIDAASAGVARSKLSFQPYGEHFVAYAGSYSILIGPASTAFSDGDSSIRVVMVGGNCDAVPARQEKLGATVNYFIGTDPLKWRRNVPVYGRITYENVYPGIDVTYYENAGELEFDFVVRSTAKPEPIHFRFDNAASLEIEKAGDLKIHGLDSLLTIRRPSAYQLVNGARREIETGFDLTGRLDAVLRISKYDSSVPLIIDPVFTYSTYLGGSRRDTPDAIAVDTQGNSYIAGQTFSGDFLLKSPMQALRGTSDAFITKFAPDGKLLYSTFIGGEGDDEAKAVSVDVLGNVYMAGSTFSQGFPVMAPKPTRYGGSGDGFIARLDANGSLVFSRYLNGDASDVATGITTDRGGNIYVTGNTRSQNFPIPWFPRDHYDAFIAKFTSTGDFIWGNLIGGSADTTSSGIVLDQDGLIYLTGTTSSKDLGTVLPLQPQLGGGLDCFVAIVNAQGTFTYSSYLGGKGREICSALAVDATGITVVGSTESSDLPTLRPVQASLAGPSDGFIAKLAIDGSRYLYSTYLGGSDSDILNNVISDGAGTIYAAGKTFSTNFPVLNSVQASNQGASDAVISKFTPTGMLSFSTYLGGGGDDTATGVALDSDRNLLVTGTTVSVDFPTEQAVQPSLRGEVDGFITKIFSDQLRPRNDDFNNAAVLVGVAGADMGNNIGATLEPGEPVVGPAGRASVWWRWTASFSGPVSVDTIGSTFDTVLAVFQGSAIDNLTLVGFDDESGGGGTSLFSFSAEQGVTYQISVNGFSSEVGTIRLQWRLRPPVISTQSVEIGEFPPVLTAGQRQTASVKLASPYPLPVTGRLTLVFTPDPAVAGVDDPAIQFSTGNRSADFSIPAHTTEAIFSDGFRSIDFQGGTVAGTITIRVALFTTEADVSPSPEPRKSAVINIGVPTISEVTITDVTDTEFKVVIDGFSTGRSVSSAVFVFVPAGGHTTDSKNVTVSVERLFAEWYQGAESRQTGSRFRLVVPFMLERGKSNNLSAIAVALTNASGTSAPVTHTFP